MSVYPLTPCFNQFLKRISLTQGQKDQLKNAQIALTQALRSDPKLSPIIVTTFIQGSYGRGTALRPRNGNISDIDIVVVTKLHKDEYTPNEVLGLFKNFIANHYKEGAYRRQNHSCGIRMQHARVDVVPAIAPTLMERGILDNRKRYSIIYSRVVNSYVERDIFSLAPIEETGIEVPKWKRGILLIPNKTEKAWEKTDPQDIIRRTRKKNKNCNGIYTQVVKCLKWWRREWFPKQKYLKSYPLEWLVEKYCEDDIRNVEDGIVYTLEGLAESKNYWNAKWYSTIYSTSFSVSNNPFQNLTREQFDEFFYSVDKALEIAQHAYDEEDLQKASNLWRKLFGDKFPRYSELF